MASGYVKWFNDSKGFGIIQPDDDFNTEVFVHYTQIRVDGPKTLAEGQKVTFELDQKTPKGPVAANVELAN